MARIAPITPVGDNWVCPCSSEKRHPRSESKPVTTIVSRIEPFCPFCGRKYKPEYRHDGDGD